MASDKKATATAEAAKTTAWVVTLLLQNEVDEQHVFTKDEWKVACKYVEMCAIACCDEQFMSDNWEEMLKQQNGKDGSKWPTFVNALSRIASHPKWDSKSPKAIRHVVRETLIPFPQISIEDVTRCVACYFEEFHIVIKKVEID